MSTFEQHCNDALPGPTALPRFVALVWPVVALGCCCPGWMDSCVSGNSLALDFECAAKSLGQEWDMKGTLW